VTPRLLVRNLRYAVLAIFVLAAVITPTSDVANLTLLAAPMCGLFAIGIVGSYVYTRHHEGDPLPWRILVPALAALGGGGYLGWRKLSSR
jgi:sec-independent protein translocase protein TatC